VSVLDTERQSACAAATRAAHERGSAQSCVSEGVRNSGLVGTCDIVRRPKAKPHVCCAIAACRIVKAAVVKLGQRPCCTATKSRGYRASPSLHRLCGCVAAGASCLLERGGRRMTHLEQQPTTWISWHENLRLAQFDLMGVAVDRCAIQSRLKSIAKRHSFTTKIVERDSSWLTWALTMRPARAPRSQ
jgi:hypothetical protein